ncbi:RNA-binding S4 domain-containing protein [Nitratireductor sp. L1-7-SE]|uniref:RNA-binding S4 domain-containing protein n=1 Tax=Nitratireductor rhodophyticola TaxID=2854036 RepID=A0ABS7R578_9HYPH|nr:RNA-binding S4 domain-containing protein [Nitratireductor rhodophyticola]MBY8916076.1 RNA-binding S4 domain-containing protein [Nitratireductor rhodophyticola]MBY8921439.1 RNA-binding S4 domain-containing protein [Nitratireductor rhodophyticola]
MSGTALERQRIDKWLFFARVVKSRSLAARLAQAGRVRVNRNKIEQAAYQIKVGDVLTISLDRRILVYRVLAPGARRGPAEEARTLYEDMTPPAPPKEAAAAAVPPKRDMGAGRPTKKERRALDRWRDDG